MVFFPVYLLISADTRRTHSPNVLTALCLRMPAQAACLQQRVLGCSLSTGGIQITTTHSHSKYSMLAGPHQTQRRVRPNGVAVAAVKRTIHGHYVRLQTAVSAVEYHCQAGPDGFGDQESTRAAAYMQIADMDSIFELLQNVPGVACACAFMLSTVGVPGTLTSDRHNCCRAIISVSHLN